MDIFYPIAQNLPGVLLTAGCTVLNTAKAVAATVQSDDVFAENKVVDVTVMK